MRAAIQERLVAAGGQWSVSVGVPGAPEATIALNADRTVLAASLFKLVLLVEALRLQRAGELDLDERLAMTPRAVAILRPLPVTLRVGETMLAAVAVERMITVSSNTGAVLIGERVGWRRSQATVARLGLHATSMASPPMTTAADMQRLLRLIAGEPADPQLLHPDDAAVMRYLAVAATHQRPRTTRIAASRSHRPQDGRSHAVAARCRPHHRARDGPSCSCADGH